MKIKIARDELLTGLQRVQGIVEKRNTMPVLSNILLETKQDGIELVAERGQSYLQESWTTVAAINARIPGYNVTTNGFIEPFHTHSIGDIEDAPNSWVHADGRDDAGTIKKLVVTLTGARRIRVQGTV